MIKLSFSNLIFYQVKSLKVIVNQARKNKLLSENAQKNLRRKYSGITLEILNRKAEVKGKSGKGIAYNEDLKSFALTLQYYSTKAYDFVRKSLDYALPDKRVIRFDSLHYMFTLKCH